MVLKYSLLGLAIVIWTFILGPLMISAESDILVYGWILLSGAGVIYALNKIVNQLIREKK